MRRFTQRIILIIIAVVGLAVAVILAPAANAKTSFSPNCGVEAWKPVTQTNGNVLDEIQTRGDVTCSSKRTVLVYVCLQYHDGTGWHFYDAGVNACEITAFGSWSYVELKFNVAVPKHLLSRTWSYGEQQASGGDYWGVETSNTMTTP